MPELKAFVKEKGYAKETEDYQHRAQSWKDTYLMAKDVYALDQRQYRTRTLNIICFRMKL